MTVSINGTSGVTFSDASVQNTAATGFGFKNRIINGQMAIAQRGTSFSTPASGAYNLDRWFLVWGGAAPSVAQVAGPAGFRNAFQVTGAASNTYIQIAQRIESYNCSDLSGATIAIQANIAVSSAQTVGWALYYANAQDNFSATTLITSGTWSATSTATTYTATITNLPSGSLNGLCLYLFPNNQSPFTSGTFTFTGVQLEKSPTATSFDYRPIGTELQLCQRYYQTSYPPGTVAGSTFTFGASITFTLQTTGGGTMGQTVPYPVTMRAAPTLTVYDSLGASGKISGTTTTVGITNNGITPSYALAYTSYLWVSTTLAGGAGIMYQYTISSEL